MKNIHFHRKKTPKKDDDSKTTVKTTRLKTTYPGKSIVTHSMHIRQHF